MTIVISASGYAGWVGKALTVYQLLTNFVLAPFTLWYFYRRKHWWSFDHEPLINPASNAAFASSSISSPTLEVLEKKAWFRFCRLCYGFAYVLCLVIVIVIGYAERPTAYFDSDASIIQCATGISYSAGANAIRIGDDGYIESADWTKTRDLCTPRDFVTRELELADGQKLKIQIPSSLDPEVESSRLVAMIQKDKYRDPIDVLVSAQLHYSDYQSIPARAVKGSNEILLWGLVIVVFLGELIRRSFLYLVAGAPFFAWFS